MRGRAMTQTDLSQEEPDPHMVGKPAGIAVKLYVNSEFVGELRGERPSESEARIYCIELQLEIDALMNKGRGYVQ